MGKSRKAELTLEEMLRSVLEVMGWQAEMLRAALRQVRKQKATGRRRSKQKPEEPD